MMKLIDQNKLFWIVQEMNMKNYYENIMILMKFIAKLLIFEKKKLVRIHFNFQVIQSDWSSVEIL
jgi:hypothetical protein